MEQMLTVVFDNEKNACNAKTALRKLAMEGRITVYGGALVVRHMDGSIAIREFDDFGVGTAVGSLIGLLGTPRELLIGSRSFAVGAPVDVDDPENARVGRDFIDDVSVALTAGKFAIVADIDADWTAPLDSEMERVGGSIFRCVLRDEQDDTHDVRIAAMKADLMQLKQEASITRCDARTKLQMRIDQLQARIDARQKEAEARRGAFEARRRARRELVERNAAARR